MPQKPFPIQANVGKTVRFALIAALFIFFFDFALAQLCQAQSIPRRLDTSNFQNQAPAAPLFEPRGPLWVTGEISPFTGRPVKIYYRPTAEQLDAAPGSSLQSPTRWRPSGRQSETPPGSSLSGSVGWTPSGRQRNTAPPSFLREGWSPDTRQSESAPSSSLRRRSGGPTTAGPPGTTSSSCAPAPLRRVQRGKQVDSPPPASLQRQNSTSLPGRQLEALPGAR
jgi:hypothetical protein